MLSGMFMRGGKIDETKRRGEGRSLSRNNELKPSVEAIRCVPLSVSLPAWSSHLSIFIASFDHRYAHTLSIINVHVCFRERNERTSSVGRKKRENRSDARKKERERTSEVETK